MIMKKYLNIIILSAIVFSGCSKEAVICDSCNGLVATIDSGTAYVKASPIDNPGICLDNKWQDGEKIGIFGTGSSNVIFDVSGKDISSDGKTARFKSDVAIPSGTLTAYSPFQEGASVSSDAITIDFPAVQKYVVTNGVPQPDPQCNIMLATGDASRGLTFRNAMAILKIGQLFEKETKVKTVEFRDLSGTPVSGKMTLSWNGGSPSAVITGEGEKITLNLGEGLEITPGQKGIFFLIVPAREYAKGFEITFTDTEGSKIVKNAGTAGGKILKRSVVYPVGDISSREPAVGSVGTLKPQAQIMTAEKLDKISILSSTPDYVYWEDGTKVQTLNKYGLTTDLRMPTLDMMMHKDLNPVEGNWLLFDETSELLPSGGVYRIKTVIHMSDDYYEVVAVPDPNVAAPYEELIVGEPLIDGNGEIDENGGVPLDITSYISSIVNEQGEEMSYAVSRSGEILLSEEMVADMYGLDTKAVMKHKFISPTLSLNSKGENVEIAVGGSISLDTRVAIRYMQGEFQYMQFTVTPEIEFSLGTTLKMDGNVERNVRLYTINVLPFPVAPGILVTPQIVLHAKVGVGGEMKVSASFTASQKLGTYSLAYNKGDGATLRWLKPAIENPTEFNLDSDGVEGSLYAYGSLGVITNISLYAMCGLGLDNELTYKFATTFNSNGGRKLSLTPEFEVTPSFTCLLGSKKFTDLTAKMDLDPVWERYIRPETTSSTIIPRYNWSPEMSIELANGNIVQTSVPMSVKGIDYNITLSGRCVEDMKVALLIYTGDDIKYILDPYGSDPTGAEYNNYVNSGLKDLYGRHYMVDKQLVNPSEKPASIIEIGTYPADEEEMTFNGTGYGTFVSGQAYGVVGALLVGEDTYPFDIGGSYDYYHPFIFWWPNRSNGQPYVVMSE